MTPQGYWTLREEIKGALKTCPSWPLQPCGLRPFQEGRTARPLKRFLVTKKDEAKAVIISVEDFLQAIVKTPQSLAILQKQAKKSGADKRTLEEIECEIAAVRKAPPHSKACP